jgi:hypothetical protein
MALRLISLAAFTLVVLAGRGGLGSMFWLESGTMVAVVALWVRAYLQQVPGSGLLLVAIVMSGAASLLRVVPAGFELGWRWDSNALYHLAQIPGLIVMYEGIRRLPPLATTGGPQRIWRRMPPLRPPALASTFRRLGGVLGRS